MVEEETEGITLIPKIGMYGVKHGRIVVGTVMRSGRNTRMKRVGQAGRRREKDIRRGP